MSAEVEIEKLAAFILAEVPGEPSQSEGAGETAARMIREYRRTAHALWQLLDDISTLDDACKSNDKLFRKQTYAKAEERYQHFTSDGYKLFRVMAGGATPEPEPETGEELCEL